MTSPEAPGTLTLLGVDGDSPHGQLAGGGDVGCRALAMAQRVVHQVTGVLAPGCISLFLTDGLKEYKTTMLDHYGPWRHPERHQDKGPMPKPRWRPLPALLYAQVVKSYRRWRIVGGTHNVVCGTRLAIEQGRARCGWTITPAFGLNLGSLLRGAAETKNGAISDCVLSSVCQCIPC